MRYVPGFRTYLPPQIQWQPTLTAHDPNPPIPLNEDSVTNYTLDIDLGTYAIAGQGPALVVDAVLPVDTGAYVIAGQNPDLDATNVETATNAPGGRTGQAGPTYGPERIAKRPRSALGWFFDKPGTRREIVEAQDALKEAQDALEQAQSATKGKERKAAIRSLFAALAEAGAEREAYATQQKAIADAQALTNERLRREAIQLELSQLSQLIEGAVAEMKALALQRRREEEEHLIRTLLLH